MIKLSVLASVAVLASAPTATLAQDYGSRTVRFGNTSGWYFDGRDDFRDFPTTAFPVIRGSRQRGDRGCRNIRLNAVAFHRAILRSQHRIVGAHRPIALDLSFLPTRRPAFVGSDGARHPVDRPVRCLADSLPTLHVTAIPMDSYGCEFALSEQPPGFNLMEAGKTTARVIPAPNPASGMIGFALRAVIFTLEYCGQSSADPCGRANLRGRRHRRAGCKCLPY
jgi:hypothetical protein